MPFLEGRSGTLPCRGGSGNQHHANRAEAPTPRPRAAFLPPGSADAPGSVRRTRGVDVEEEQQVDQVGGRAQERSALLTPAVVQRAEQRLEGRVREHARVLWRVRAARGVVENECRLAEARRGTGGRVTQRDVPDGRADLKCLGVDEFGEAPLRLLPLLRLCVLRGRLSNRCVRMEHGTPRIGQTCFAISRSCSFHTSSSNGRCMTISRFIQPRTDTRSPIHLWKRSCAWQTKRP